MLVNPNQPGVYRCKPASAPPRSCRPLFSPRWEPSSLPILPSVTQLKRLAACHPAQAVALVQLALFGQSRWLQSHLLVSIYFSGCPRSSSATGPALLPSPPPCSIFPTSADSSLRPLLGLPPGQFTLEPPPPSLARRPRPPARALVGACGGRPAQVGGGGQHLDALPPGKGSQAARHRACSPASSSPALPLPPAPPDRLTAASECQFSGRLCLLSHHLRHDLHVDIQLAARVEEGEGGEGEDRLPDRLLREPLQPRHCRRHRLGQSVPHVHSSGSTGTIDQISPHTIIHSLLI